MSSETSCARSMNDGCRSLLFTPAMIRSCVDLPQPEGQASPRPPAPDGTTTTHGLTTRAHRRKRHSVCFGTGSPLAWMRSGVRRGGVNGSSPWAFEAGWVPPQKGWGSQKGHGASISRFIQVGFEHVLPATPSSAGGKP